MAIGGQNQTNRLGHGVAGAQQITTGLVEVPAATEIALEDVLDSVFSGSTMAPYGPFEVRFMSSSPGAGVPLEVRTLTTIPGYPIPHLPTGGGAHPDGLTLYLAQNVEAPSTRILIANPNGATDLDLYVLVLG